MLWCHGSSQKKKKKIIMKSIIQRMFYYVKVTLKGIQLLVLMPFNETFIFSLLLDSMRLYKLSASIKWINSNCINKDLIKNIPTMSKFP